MTTMMKKIKVKQTGADTAELWVAGPVAKVTTRSTTIIIISIIIIIIVIITNIIVIVIINNTKSLLQIFKSSPYSSYC